MLVFLFRTLFAVVILCGCTRYFALVLPTPWALLIGLVLGALELFGPLLLNKRTTGKGFGGAFGAALAIATVALGFLMWPLATWAVMHFGNQPREMAAAWAAIPAVAVGFTGAGHGSNSEHLRLATVLFAVATAMLALLQALPEGRIAAAAGGLSVLVATLVARTVGVWPPGHVKTLNAVCAAVGLAATVNVGIALFQLI